MIRLKRYELRTRLAYKGMPRFERRDGRIVPRDQRAFADRATPSSGRNRGRLARLTAAISPSASRLTTMFASCR